MVPADFARRFKRIYTLDFEFHLNPGDRPTVVCLVAHELISGERFRLWHDQLANTPPFPCDADTLVIAYFASAEMDCFLSLGWALPVNLLDLFVEFKCQTNGLKLVTNRSLIGALSYFGKPHLESTAKDDMRDLIMTGGPWTDQEQASILDYCESDVTGLNQLFDAMSPGIDLDRALLRGAYMKAVSHMQHNGVPVDTAILTLLNTHHPVIIDDAIRKTDEMYDVFENGVFKKNKFLTYLSKNGMSWPLDEHGEPSLKDETFQQMERIYPEIAPLRGLRSMQSRFRLPNLPVGSDGRNRTLLSPFGAETGRNTPSTTKSVLGLHASLRSLIRAEPGHGLAYIDWSQQEFGIGAALSGDPNMIAAYQSGDCYLEFAKQSGLVPQSATKQSHKDIRNKAKQCILGTQYGMGEQTLSKRIGCSQIEARRLLDLHRETYKTFWAWSDGAVDHATLRGKLWTVFGWTRHVTRDFNSRSLANFLMQANGAEMLRLACIFGTEDNIKICAPIHDAVLIHAPVDVLNDHIYRMQAHMARASHIVLGGFELRSDVETFIYPDRFQDDRGTVLWSTLMALIDNLTTAECCTGERPSADTGARL